MFVVTILATCHRAERSRLETISVQHPDTREALNKAGIYMLEYLRELVAPDSGHKLELNIRLTEIPDFKQSSPIGEQKEVLLNLVDEMSREEKNVRLKKRIE